MRRTRLKILIDVLEALAREEMPASRVCEAANMPYDRLKPLLDRLEKHGLVRVRTVSRSRVYGITSRGLRELERLRRAHATLRSLGLE